MAKKRVVDTMDFINEVYGMTASYESSDYGYGARGRKAYSSEYTKPVNPYVLAESLAFIKADEYKQTAQTAVITALGEHARLLNNMRKKGYSNREIRSFAESSGFGEVSLEEVKDTVVEGAKDAWKAFLALIDKLIEVIKQFIRGLFDKEKKIATVLGKLKAANKRVKDAGRADVASDVKMAFINPKLALAIAAPGLSYDYANKTAKVVAREGRATSIIHKLGDLSDSLDSGTAKGLIVGANASVESIRDIANIIGIKLPASVNRIFNYTYSSNRGAALNEKNTNKPGSGSEYGFESINVDKYKADWNTFIGCVKEVFSEIKGSRGTEKNTVKNLEDTTNLEGLGISISSIPRGKNAITYITDVAGNLEQVFNMLKSAKLNNRLEKKITALGNLKRDIIKNKDSKYSNKIAQLGRIAIGKTTQVLTYTISITNMIYATLFKVSAVTVKALISVTEKDSSARKDFNED